jgi:hypothetical protein
MRFWDKEVTGPEITLFIVIDSTIFKTADIEALAKQIKDTGIKFQPKFKIITTRPKDTKETKYLCLGEHLLAFYKTYIMEHEWVRLSRPPYNYTMSPRTIAPSPRVLGTIQKTTTQLKFDNLKKCARAEKPETTVTMITKRKILAATAVKTRKPSQNAVMNNLSAPDVSTSRLSPTAILMS